MNWGGSTVLGGVLVATARTPLCDILDTNVQLLELHSDDALGHTPTQILQQKPHTVVLREHEGVEAHTLPHRGTVLR